MYPKSVLKQYLPIESSDFDIEIELNSQINWYFQHTVTSIGANEYDFHCSTF